MEPIHSQPINLILEWILVVSLYFNADQKISLIKYLFYYDLIFILNKTLSKVTNISHSERCETKHREHLPGWQRDDHTTEGSQGVQADPKDTIIRYTLQLSDCSITD